MDRLERGRRNTRNNINKEWKALETEMKLPEKSAKKLNLHLGNMLDLWKVLQKEDQEIMNLLLDSAAQDAEVDAESEESCGYRDKVLMMKMDVESSLTP